MSSEIIEILKEIISHVDNHELVNKYLIKLYAKFLKLENIEGITYCNKLLTFNDRIKNAKLKNLNLDVA